MRLSERRPPKRRNPFANYHPDGKQKSLHMTFAALQRADQVLSFTTRYGPLVRVPSLPALLPVDEVLREASRMSAFIGVREAQEPARSRRIGERVERFRELELASEKAGPVCWCAQ